MDAPVYPGCIVPSRLRGVIDAEQTEEGETERNDRLLAVAGNSAAHRSIRQPTDLGDEMKGKRFEVKRRAGSKRARALVMAAIKRRR
jgi:inorganic pyrophosphatase